MFPLQEYDSKKFDQVYKAYESGIANAIGLAFEMHEQGIKNKIISELMQRLIEQCRQEILPYKVFIQQLNIIPPEIAVCYAHLLPNQAIRMDFLREVFYKVRYSNHELAVQVYGSFPENPEDDFYLGA